MVTETRAELRSAVPPRYRWYRHVALIAVFVAAGLVLTLGQLGDLSTGDGMALVAILGFLNFGEYATHRWTLHRNVFPRRLYHRHVIEHHAFFTYEQMAVDSWNDIRWVLFPWWALPLLIVGVLPFFLLATSLVSPRAGWLFLLAVTLYYGVYEVVHTLAHLPADHRWAGRRWIRSLTHHHRVHHNPQLMRRYNFNFILPIFDRLFGTMYSGRG